MVGDDDRRRAPLGWLAQALTVLNEREKRIIASRRLADESATLEALGDELGISKERVRQIENRALEKLRKALTRAAIRRTPSEAVADSISCR